jgi:KDO2-lipid IV(A) lauroyltransferase
MMSYILYRTASALAGTLPRPQATKLATAVAFVFYVCRPATRRNIRRNYERLGMPRERTFGVFRNFSLAVTDLLRLSRMSREELLAAVDLRGAEHLERALAKGKGAILFAPHLGPWEIAGAYMSVSGYPMHTVALEHPSSRVTAFFSTIRRKWGFSDYPTSTCAAGLTRALRKGEPVVLLIDRNFSRRGMIMRFLGRDVLLPDGHVSLALRSGAPLLPSCSLYTREGRIEVVIGPEIEAPSPDTPAVVIGNRCLERIEAFIRAYPDQWFAFDHVWGEEHGA